VDNSDIDLYEEARKLANSFADKNISAKQAAIICAITLSAILKSCEFSEHGAVSFFVTFLKKYYEAEEV
jgi:hypothetical protein